MYVYFEIYVLVDHFTGKIMGSLVMRTAHFCCDAYTARLYSALATSVSKLMKASRTVAVSW